MNYHELSSFLRLTSSSKMEVIPWKLSTSVLPFWKVSIEKLQCLHEGLFICCCMRESWEIEDFSTPICRCTSFPSRQTQRSMINVSDVNCRMRNRCEGQGGSCSLYKLQLFLGRRTVLTATCVQRMSWRIGVLVWHAIWQLLGHPRRMTYWTWNA